MYTGKYPIRKYKFKNLPINITREVIFAEAQPDNRLDRLIFVFNDNNDNTPDTLTSSYKSFLFKQNGRIFWNLPYLTWRIANTESIRKLFNIGNTSDYDLLSIDNSWILDYLYDKSELNGFRPSLLYWDKELASDSANPSLTTLYALDISNISSPLDLFLALKDIPSINTDDGVHYFVFPSNGYGSDVDFKLHLYGYSKRAIDKYKQEGKDLDNLLNHIKEDTKEQLTLGLPGFLTKSATNKTLPHMPILIDEGLNINLVRTVRDVSFEDSLPSYFDSNENTIHLGGEVASNFLYKENMVTIDMDGLSKSLYLLFLKHQEGLNINKLSMYYDEFSSIFEAITRYREVRNQPILSYTEEDLGILTKSKLYEVLSDIEDAFKEAFDENDIDDDDEYYAHYLPIEEKDMLRIDLGNTKVIWKYSIV